jgi:hypothetical protein
VDGKVGRHSRGEKEDIFRLLPVQFCEPETHSLAGSGTPLLRHLTAYLA